MTATRRWGAGNQARNSWFSIVPAQLFRPALLNSREAMYCFTTLRTTGVIELPYQPIQAGVPENIIWGDTCSAVPVVW